MTVVTFFAYGIDKWRARSNRRRTPERTLHLLELAGGCAVLQKRSQDRVGQSGGHRRQVAAETTPHLPEKFARLAVCLLETVLAAEVATAQRNPKDRNTPYFSLHRGDYSHARKLVENLSSVARKAQQSCWLQVVH